MGVSERESYTELKTRVYVRFEGKRNEENISMKNRTIIKE